MRFRRVVFIFCVNLLAAGALRPPSAAQSSSSASSSSHVGKPAAAAGSPLDSGVVSAGVYRNPAFGFTCRIPAAWVLRTEEMNARDDAAAAKEARAALDRTAPSASLRAGGNGCPHIGGCGRVLLATFSRPPEARGEDVNGSIVIAAESVTAYPGLKEAAQYFGPVGEVAKAQGFEVVEEPYEFAIGTKKAVRGDFQKDVGSRVMRQSTLVVLARGYAVSFTFIGGTEDEVEELVQGLSFGVGAKTVK
jgi:hypothetical protein